ncbi:uncharacterized protein LOC124595805 isoform X2 [Schistocerca americana]|uniref:uncharacterized protein LOC124595805 isoform X2 n=1 Tax=Schistocerca americana TaxID=7009 RepID=UPI001F4FD45D|nr:uncharacterized protein LOC124595805 isoform X2 [Schistocerca americana]
MSPKAISPLLEELRRLQEYDLLSNGKEQQVIPECMVTQMIRVMARRRKAAVRRRKTKSVKLSSTKNKKKLNGLSEHKLNGILSHRISDTREDKNTNMCCGDLQPANATDTLHQSPPAAIHPVQPVSSIHKKFGKFRCLQEVIENEIMSPEGSDVSKEVIETSQDLEPLNEVVIEQQEELDISNAEQVVWTDEYVEDMIVCEGVEIEVGDTRSQDDQELDYEDSRECEADQVSVVKGSYCHDCGRGAEIEECKCVTVDKLSANSNYVNTSNCRTNQINYVRTTNENTNVHSEQIVKCFDGCGEESDIGNQNIIEDCITYEVGDNLETTANDETVVSEEFVVELPVPQDQVLCETDSQSDISTFKTEVRNTDTDLISSVMPVSSGSIEDLPVAEEEHHALEGCDSVHKEYLSCQSPRSSLFGERIMGEETKDEIHNFSIENIVPCVNEVTVITEGTDQSCEDSGSLDINEAPCFTASACANEKNCRTEEVPERKPKSVSSRSRSGSTDTTGSESSSNCSIGVRRSNRIRSIGLSRQKSRSKSDLPSSPKCVARETSDGKHVGAPELVCPPVSNDSIQKDSLSHPVSMCTFPAVPQSTISAFDLDSSKPVKVKSRWRRSSELEMGGNRSGDSDVVVGAQSVCVSGMTDTPCNTSNNAPSFPANENMLDVVSTKKEVRNERKEREEREMEERLRNYITLYENEYLTERSTSKETKRMVCDCFLTKEELARGDMGCGEDCLNRLLMIECGSRCAMGDRCTNKRFQRHEYARCDVFKTEKKGFGLRTLDDLSGGAFIMEYVGEVLDPKEFRRRAKDYAKEKNRHYYFMALKSDSIIDATVKGNVSRFINHSCEPNAETQKWTVNGELRIGFFSKRNISAGEEITFDYQFQRYGKEAQKCLCDAANCRGWIGEDPEKEKRERKLKKEKEIKKKKEEKRKDVKDYMDDMDLEEEIEKLSVSGLKNRAHTLTMCRLMVRAEDCDSRIQLLKLIQEGEPACRRLFLDYHGLRLMWSWMVDATSNNESEMDLKMEILQTLVKLPIPNKTVLQDSKVLFMVQKWLECVRQSGSVNDTSNESEMEDSVTFAVTKKERFSADEECVTNQILKLNANAKCPKKLGMNECDRTKPRTRGSPPSIDYDETIQDIENEKQVVDAVAEIPETDILAKKSTESDDEGFGEAPEKGGQSEDYIRENNLDRIQPFIKLASGLLNEWSCLKEVFRIPKRERIEQMKEHEREADRGYKEYLDKEEMPDKQSYDRHWRQERFHSEYEKGVRKRSRDSPDPERVKKNSRFDDSTRTLVPIPKISKEERRHLFALRVAQEEEEERQRRQQQELWRQNDSQCMSLRLDPNVVTPTNGSYPCFFDPSTNTWQPLPPQDTSLLTPSDMGPNEASSVSMSVHHLTVPPPHTNVSPLTIPPHCPPPTHIPPPHSQSVSHTAPLPLHSASLPHVSLQPTGSILSHRPPTPIGQLSTHRLSPSTGQPQIPSLPPAPLLPQGPPPQLGTLPPHGPPPPLGPTHGPPPPHIPPPPHASPLSHCSLQSHGPPLPHAPSLPHGPTPPCGPPMPKGPTFPQGPPPGNGGPVPHRPPPPHAPLPSHGPPLPHGPPPALGPAVPQGPPPVHGPHPPHGSTINVLPPPNTPVSHHCPPPTHVSCSNSIHVPPVPSRASPPHGLPPSHCPPPSPHHGNTFLQPPPQITPPPHVTMNHVVPKMTPRRNKGSPLLPTPPLSHGPPPSGFIPQPDAIQHGPPPLPCDPSDMRSGDRHNLPFHRRICALPPPYGDRDSSPTDSSIQPPYSQKPSHLCYSPIQTPPYHHAHPVSVPIQQPFTPTPPPPLLPPPIRLPPKWKSAKDAEGRVYYYHVKTRVSQWEPPQWTQIEQQPDSDSSTTSSDDEEDDDDDDDDTTTSDEEEEEEEEEEDEEEEEVADEEEEEADEIAQEDKTEDCQDNDDDNEDDDVPMEEKDDTHEEKIKPTAPTIGGVGGSPQEFSGALEEEESDSRLCLDDDKRKEKRREGLVQERIISPRREEDKSDNKRYREIKEKLRKRKELARQHAEKSKRYHRESKFHSNTRSSEKPVTVAADTSSDTARKIKDQFRLQMAGVIVQYLNPYRKPECQKARITNTDDFKHLARKLTHFVMLKELKHCRSVEDLECNDNVKHKARDFIKKYMAKFGAVYQRPKEEDQ